MLNVRLRRVAAWSPGIETPGDWHAWCREPVPLASEGSPDVPFLPPAVRRRCTRLTKMMLRAAFDATTDEERPRVRTVFGSRHGAIHVAVKILAAIAHGEQVSPMQFSHSVHNAQAGLFSIAAGNREASSSLAGAEDTFPAAFLEALLLLERRPDTPVLLVVGDEPLPDNLKQLIEEPAGAYALAMVIESEGKPGDGPLLGVELGGDPQSEEAPWPQALEFLRWFESGETSLRLGHRCPLQWTRKG